MSRDREKQINLDFTKYPEALAVYKAQHNKTDFVATAILEKDQRSREQNKYITWEEVVEIKRNMLDLMQIVKFHIIGPAGKEILINRLELLEEKLKLRL